jgi:hypothetical protein
MNILGPFLKAFRKRQLILVAVKNFTKWVEVKTLIEITTSKVIFLLWKNIIYKFGLTHMLNTENDTQFDNKKMRE